MPKRARIYLVGFCLSLFGGSFANPPNPILFVHGINSDAKMWGQRPLNGSMKSVGTTHRFKDGCKTDWNLVEGGRCLTGTQAWGYYCDDGWTLDGDRCVQYWQANVNLTDSYKPGSTADLFATNFNCSRDAASINHNGLYFYNSQNDAGDYAPFAALHNTYDNNYKAWGQTYQLYNRIKEILDDYYPNAWQNDLSKKIVIVAHSQGGLITRNLFREYTDPSPSNPVSHIRKIVTIGTPHTGSQWARTNPVPPLNQVKSAALSLNSLARKVFDWLPFANPIAPTTTGFLRGQDYLDASKPYLTTLNAAPYPRNPTSGLYVPITAIYALTPGMASNIYNTALEGIYNSCIDGTVSTLLTGVDAGLAYLDYKLDWFSVSGCGPGPSQIQCKQSKCVKIARDAVSPLTPILRSMDATWSGNSDFIVEMESQRWDALATKPYAFKQSKVTENVVPHSDILSFKGEGAQSQDLYNAVIANDPVPLNAGIISLLL